LGAQNKGMMRRSLRGLAKVYGEGMKDFDTVKVSMSAITGHLIHGHTYRLRKKIYDGTIFTKQ